MQEQDLVYDSDDNEEIVLDRLQALYNEPHRSNIFVTGTLSIVTDKKKAVGSGTNPDTQQSQPALP